MDLSKYTKDDYLEYISTPIEELGGITIDDLALQLEMSINEADLMVQNEDDKTIIEAYMESLKNELEYKVKQKKKLNHILNKLEKTGDYPKSEYLQEEEEIEEELSLLICERDEAGYYQDILNLVV